MSANPEAGAVVTDVQSAAAAIEARMSEPAEIPETEAEAVETAEPVDEAETTEEIPEEVEEVEETDESEPSEDAAESDDQEAEEVEEVPEFQSVEELAEATGMSLEDFLGTIKGKVKVNGEESEVTLSELTKGYQMESDYRRKTMELAENRKEFEQEQEQARQYINSRVTEANQLSAILERELVGDYNAVDWNALRANDPAEYSAKMTDFQNRQAQLNQVKAHAMSEAQRLQEEAQEQQQAAYKDVLAKEQEALYSAIPEWRDAEAADKGKTEIKDFLKSYGFNSNEIAQIYDHRHVLLIRDAMKGQRVAKQEDVVKKQIKKVPKLVKPGAKKTKQDMKRSRNAELKTKYKKSGKQEDLAALLFDRI